ncbi:MAG: hypothetical protein H6925_04835 [Holosporaceae bacterium]|nr:MAG: hypothetical protein H6925_04835 [Holosporaceae bacterium]
MTGQDIVFSMENDDVRWTDGQRTTEAVNLGVAGERRGELRVDPGHGQYHEEGQSVFSGLAAAEDTLVYQLIQEMVTTQAPDWQERLPGLLPFFPKEGQRQMISLLPRNYYQAMIAQHLPVTSWAFAALPALVPSVVASDDPRVKIIFQAYSPGMAPPNISYNLIDLDGIAGIITGDSAPPERSPSTDC